MTTKSRAAIEGTSQMEAAGLVTPDRDARVAHQVAEFMKEAAARQRSSSPAANWVQAHRYRGIDGATTPGSVRGASSGITTQRSAISQRAAHDNVILTAARSQIEAAEQRLTAKLERLQNQNEKMRDSLMQRFEDRISGLETSHPRLQKKLAEITGSVNGLSDGIQDNIKRLDQLDDRVHNSKHTLQEDFSMKWSQLNDQIMKANSGYRVHKEATEESTKKLSLMLQRLDDRAQDREGALADLHDRLQALEAQRFADMETLRRELGHEAHRIGPDAGAEVAHIETLEKVVRSLEQEMSALRRDQEGLELHRRAQEHEEHIKALQTKMEARERNDREFAEKLKVMDMKLEPALLQQLEDAQKRREQSEEIEVLTKRFESLQEEQQKKREDVPGDAEAAGFSASGRIIHAPANSDGVLLADAEPVDIVLADRQEVTLPAVIQTMAAQLEEMEAKQRGLEAQVEANASSMLLPELVEAVRSVVPTVQGLSDDIASLKQKEAQMEETVQGFQAQVVNLTDLNKTPQAEPEAFSEARTALGEATEALRKDLGKVDGRCDEACDLAGSASKSAEDVKIELRSLQEDVSRCRDEQAQGLKAVTGLQADVQSMVQSYASQLDQLKSLEGIGREALNEASEGRAELHRLKEQVAATSSDSLQERLQKLEAFNVADLTPQVEGVHRELGDLAQDLSQLKDCRKDMSALQDTVSDLKAELAPLKALQDTIGTVESLKQQVQQISEANKESNSAVNTVEPNVEETLARHTSELQELRRDLQVRGQAPDVVPTDAKDDSKKGFELLQEFLKEGEAEKEVQDRVNTRIDEMLTIVQDALLSTHHLQQAAPGGSEASVSAEERMKQQEKLKEVEETLSVLTDHDRLMGELEGQMQARMEAYGAEVKTITDTGFSKGT